jgi:hypothetical protein
VFVFFTGGGFIESLPIELAPVGFFPSFSDTHADQVSDAVLTDGGLPLQSNI